MKIWFEIRLFCLEEVIGNLWFWNPCTQRLYTGGTESNVNESSASSMSNCTQLRRFPMIDTAIGTVQISDCQLAHTANQHYHYIPSSSSVSSSLFQSTAALFPDQTRAGDYFDCITSTPTSGSSSLLVHDHDPLAGSVTEFHEEYAGSQGMNVSMSCSQRQPIHRCMLYAAESNQVDIDLDEFISTQTRCKRFAFGLVSFCIIHLWLVK